METQFPKVMYSKTGYKVVQNANELKDLGTGWVDSPTKVEGSKPDENGFVPYVQYQDVSSKFESVGELHGDHTYHDRIVWQAQGLGIKIDKRWSDETLLRKIAELQPLSRDGIEEANKAVPDDQELDYDPTLTGPEREIKSQIAAGVDQASKAKSKGKD